MAFYSCRKPVLVSYDAYWETLVGRVVRLTPRNIYIYIRVRVCIHRRRPYGASRVIGLLPCIIMNTRTRRVALLNRNEYVTEGI